LPDPPTTLSGARSYFAEPEIVFAAFLILPLVLVLTRLNISDQCVDKQREDLQREREFTDKKKAKPS
jgi:hypothetical protein